MLAEKFSNLRQRSSLDLSSHTHNTGDSIKLSPLRNALPKATGGNKLTESIIPGYTGIG